MNNMIKTLVAISIASSCTPSYACGGIVSADDVYILCIEQAIETETSDTRKLLKVGACRELHQQLKKQQEKGAKDE